MSQAAAETGPKTLEIVLAELADLRRRLESLEQKERARHEALEQHVVQQFGPEALESKPTVR